MPQPLLENRLMELEKHGYRIKIKVVIDNEECQGPRLNYWMFLDMSRMKYISDVKDAVRHKLIEVLNCHVKKREVNLFLSDYFLPPEETTHVLDKDDLVTVLLDKKSDCLISTVNSLVTQPSKDVSIESSSFRSPQLKKRKLSGSQGTLNLKCEESLTVKNKTPKINGYIKKQKNNKEIITPEIENRYEDEEQESFKVSPTNGSTNEEAYLLSLFPEVPRKRRKNRKTKENEDDIPKKDKKWEKCKPKVAVANLGNDNARSHIRFNESSSESRLTANENGVNSTPSLPEVNKVNLQLDFQSPNSKDTRLDPLHCGSAVEEKSNELHKLSKHKECGDSIFSNLLALKNSTKAPVFTRKDSGSLVAKSDIKKKKWALREPQDNVSKIYFNDDEDQAECEMNVNSLVKDPSVTENYDSFPLMSCFPRVGNIIAFKMLEMSSDYTPEVSAYVKGEVLQVFHESQECQIKLLDTNRSRRAGKFDILSGDEMEEDEFREINLPTNINLKFTDLLEPKLIFP